MGNRSWLHGLGCSLLLLASQLSLAEALRVDDFVLLDQNGAAHQMHYHRDAAAIVLIVHGNGCQIVRSTLPDYRALRDEFADKGVFIPTCAPDVQALYTRIWTDLQK